MWTDRKISEFISNAMELANESETDHLRQLVNGVRSGELHRLYGDLPTHPLFLQMILDDAAQGRIAKRNRGELVRDWIEQKLRRDIKVGRETPIEVIDIDSFVEQMMRLHEQVAMTMTECQDGAWVLTEEIGSDDIVESAKDIFNSPTMDISTILGCSVLSAVTPRNRGVMPIKFLLRVCQEFFLALALHRVGKQSDGYPEAVVDFWKDLEPGTRA
jgi:hypothetical protein